MVGTSFTMITNAASAVFMSPIAMTMASSSGISGLPLAITNKEVVNENNYNDSPKFGLIEAISDISVTSDFTTYQQF